MRSCGRNSRSTMWWIPIRTGKLRVSGGNRGADGVRGVVEGISGSWETPTIFPCPEVRIWEVGGPGPIWSRISVVHGNHMSEKRRSGEAPCQPKFVDAVFGVPRADQLLYRRSGVPKQDWLSR